MKIWLSQVFSLVSAATLAFVLIGKIYSLTSSTVAVGIYLFFYYLPTAILGPFVGVFIDNWNKRSILFYSNLIQSLIVLFFLGVKQRFWIFYGLGFFYSLGDEFYNPTVAVSLPTLVKKKELTTANSLFFLTTQVSIVAGSFVGGLMLKFFPNFVYIFLSVILISAGILCYWLPKKILGGRQAPLIHLTHPLEFVKNFNLNGFWKKTQEGYQFIKNEPLILFPIMLLAGLQALAGMGMIILPSLAKMIKLEFADSSILIIMPACLGALTGSYLLGTKNQQLRKNVFVVRGLYILSICLILLPFLSLVIHSPTIISLFLGYSLGLGYVFIYVPLQTLIQEHTPFPVRGRVFGTLSTLATLAAVLPIFISTTLVDLFGPRLVLISLGLIIFCLTFFTHRWKEYIINFNYYKQFR